jgi:twitching motility protein PilT
MKPIDWLLAHLDEPGVSEIVLAIGRPAAVRGPDGLRPITQMNFGRNDIETLVAGTPISGLIGSPTSLAPADMHVDQRRLVVEVVRQGFNAALRIALRGSPEASEKTTPLPTVTKPQPTVPPDDAPLVSVRMTKPSVRTPTAPPPAAQPTVPPDDPPLVAVRMTKSTVSRTATTTPLPLAITPLSTTTMPRLVPEPVEPAAQPELAHDKSFAAPDAISTDGVSPVENLDRSYLASLAGGGEIVDSAQEDVPKHRVPEYGSAPEVAGEAGAPEQRPGSIIIDEHTDITALHALLDAAYRLSASDLHVIANQPVTIRRLGGLTPLDVNALPQPVDRTMYSALLGALDPTLATRFLLPLLGPSAKQRLAEVGYVDFGFRVPGKGRVRANISQQQDGLAGTFRLCRATIPTLDALGLPHELEKVVRHHQGLVVIAGPSGHGKTTTMAALVDLLNSSSSDHIITIEDPVEIEHPAKRAIVSHREVGRHTLSFVSALKASLREDPDVIVIGELRDRESVEIALTAAETGHLVLSTISTPSAVKTIDRLIDMFPPDDQIQVRASISGTLRAVIAQRLLPNATRDGLVVAIELVTGVLPLATMVRENKLFQLPSLMQRGRAFGMIRLDDSLAEHVRAKRLTRDDALAAAENKRELAAVLAAPPSPTNVRELLGKKRPS